MYDSVKLLIDAAGKNPAINHQQVTGNETGGIGGEKNCGARQLFEFAEPSHRRAYQELSAALGSIEQSCIQACAEYARNEGTESRLISINVDERKSTRASVSKVDQINRGQSRTNQALGSQPNACQLACRYGDAPASQLEVSQTTQYKGVSRYQSRTLQPQYHSVNPDVVIPSSIKPMLSTIRRRPSRILNTSLICILRSLLP